MELVLSGSGLLGRWPSSCEFRFHIDPLSAIGGWDCIEPLVGAAARFQVVFEDEDVVSV